MVSVFVLEDARCLSFCSFDKARNVPGVAFTGNSCEIRGTKLHFNSQHVNGTFTNILFLVGYLGRYQKTNNCLYDMSPFVALYDKLKWNYNYKINVT